MFGHHARKREKKRLTKERGELDRQKQEFASQQPKAREETENYEQETINKRAQEAKDRRNVARKEGREYGLDFLKQDIHGIDPKKRQALQYEANRNIDRSYQSANRRLLGEQSSRGIVGRGGVGYAQQRDLNRLSNEARGQVDRDLTKLDSDLSMKKLAALMAVEQGEASQSQLDRQGATDDLRLNEERKRQRSFEDKIDNLLFKRL